MERLSTLRAKPAWAPSLSGKAKIPKWTQTKQHNLNMQRLELQVIARKVTERLNEADTSEMKQIIVPIIMERVRGALADANSLLARAEAIWATKKGDPEILKDIENEMNKLDRHNHLLKSAMDLARLTLRETPVKAEPEDD